MAYLWLAGQTLQDVLLSRRWTAVAGGTCGSLLCFRLGVVVVEVAVGVVAVVVAVVAEVVVEVVAIVVVVAVVVDHVAAFVVAETASVMATIMINPHSQIAAVVLSFCYA